MVVNIISYFCLVTCVVRGLTAISLLQKNKIKLIVGFLQHMKCYRMVRREVYMIGTVKRDLNSMLPMVVVVDLVE